MNTAFMNRLVLPVIVLAAVAGCSAAPAPAAHPPATNSVPLSTSFATGQGNWAIVVMGQPGSATNAFWELFVQRSGGSTWTLVTPPGVPDNGGLVAAGAGSTLLAGFRPSQHLAFSPLAVSTDAGRSWKPGVLDAALADEPDALALGTAGQEAAATTRGVIVSSASASSWTKLATSATGHGCGAVAENASPLWYASDLFVGVSCSRPGVAGVFQRTAGSWQAAGPALPSTDADDRVQVLRLREGTALLLAGTDLFASWAGAARISAALGGVASITATGTGTGGSAWVLTGSRAATISAPGTAWQQLPRVPPGTQVLADGGQEALAVSGAKLTIWRLAAGDWTKQQVINVPIDYGSSGL